ncbi:MAG: acyltransferase family protein [bacterium]
MNQVNIPQSDYRAEIDGLRAFAVLSVVIFHAFPNYLSGGFVGVDVFFVISGFLITGHIFEKLETGSFSFSDFFSRRVRRLFPALILVMGSSLVFGWFSLLADEYAQLGKHIASGAVFVLNFVLVGESGYFDNAAEAKPMLHLWSLAVEEQFYIIWPVVLWLAWKHKLNTLTITVFVMVVSFVINIKFFDSNPIETFFFPISRFWELLAGSVLAWLMFYKKEALSSVETFTNKYFLSVFDSKPVMKGDIVISNVLAFLGFLLLLYGVTSIHEGLAFPSYWALIPVSGALLVIAAGSKAWLNRVLLMNPVLVWFGLISYPLYLWHWPILSFLQIIIGEAPNDGMKILAVFLSVILAWLTYIFVEKPIRLKSIKISNIFYLIFLVMLLGVSGFYVYKNSGLQERSAVLAFESNLDELTRTVAKEDKCLNFLGLQDSKFDYCKVGSVGKEGAIAIIGDSHAHASFPGISESLEKYDITTVLLANSSCPPLEGSPWGRSDKEIRFCAERVEQILSTVEKIDNLKIVLIFTRGTTYWTGTEPAKIDSVPTNLTIESYFSGLQRTFNRLNEMNLKIVYVTENPELAYQARACLPRPFNLNVGRRCEQSLDNVLGRQKEYRDYLSKVEGVDVLDANDAFCDRDRNRCFAVDASGRLLYTDDDHLSVFGSERQFDKVIKPYLEKIEF